MVKFLYEEEKHFNHDNIFSSYIVLSLLSIGNSVANKTYDTVNCTIPDIIENIELGDCGSFNFDAEPLQGSVTYASGQFSYPTLHSMQGWIRLMIKVQLMDGKEIGS